MRDAVARWPALQRSECSGLPVAAARATAVTAAVMKATSAAPAEDPIVLRFDRPFVCGIVDLETGAPLFLGTVENLT